MEQVLKELNWEDTNDNRARIELVVEDGIHRDEKTGEIKSIDRHIFQARFCQIKYGPKGKPKEIGFDIYPRGPRHRNSRRPAHR